MKKYTKPTMNITRFGSECRILTEDTTIAAISGTYSAYQLNESLFDLKVNATKTIQLRELLSLN